MKVKTTKIHSSQLQLPIVGHEHFRGRHSSDESFFLPNWEQVAILLIEKHSTKAATLLPCTLYSLIFLSQRKNSKNYIFLTAEAIIDGHEHFLEGHSSDESLFLSKNLQRKRKHPSREEILLLNLANPLRNWIAKHFDWKRP